MTQDELLKSVGVFITEELKEKGTVTIPNVCTLFLVDSRKGKTYSPKTGKYVTPRYKKRLKARVSEVLRKNIC